MAKMKKQIKETQELPEKVEEIQLIQLVELIPFDKALAIFKRDNPLNIISTLEKEIIRVFVQKKVPKLEMTIEEWKNILNKF